MEVTEFIIALTEHRVLGHILAPYLIRQRGPYYSIECLVKSRNLGSYDYEFTPVEKQLIKAIENYSEEKLARKFSRGKGFTQFFSEMDSGFFQDQVVPYVEKMVYSCLKILMHEKIRLFRKAVQYSNLYEEDLIVIHPVFAEPVFCFDRRQEETRYELKIFQDGNEVKLLDRSFLIVTQEPGSIYFQNQLYIFETFQAKKIQPFLKKAFVSISKSAEEKYFSTFVLHTIRDFKVKATGFRILEEEATPTAWLMLENNLRLEPSLSLHFEYGNESYISGSSRESTVRFIHEKGEFTFIKTDRNREWESRIIRSLAEFGLLENQGFYLPSGISYLENESAFYELINWLNRNQAKLFEMGIGIRQGKLDKEYFTGDQDMKVETKSSPDWFDVFIVVSFGDYKVPFVKLRDLIMTGVREFELPDGKIAVLPQEWFSRFSEILPHARVEGDRLKIKKHHFMLLKVQVPEAQKVLKNLPDGGLNPDVPLQVPSGLKAELRSYQKIGYLWLFQLHQHNFGGCLADDMGLGKTLQTLAFLLKLKKLRKLPGSGSGNGQLTLFGTPEIQEAIQPASLVVVPTSLVHNWANEIGKFTPSLNFYQHVGAGRTKVADLSEVALSHDIILTTYGTVRNDIDILVRTQFFYLVLDESQYIKNSESKTYKAVCKIRAQNRLVLTGTPIENSLSDLWSQMNFLNNGLLGNQSFFRNYYQVPIERNGDEFRQENLKMLLKPFILRRTKEQVARDLPPLMEQVRYCAMSSEQQVIYEREKSVIRNKILETIDREGVSKQSSFLVLQGLTRLRQLANHPSLVLDDEETESGKFGEIFSELANLMAENHKVLIFSSFVKHLNLLKSGIEGKGWKYSMLTGQTTDREEVIRQFHNDPQNRIFLISLKAGGVGLNLTGADYVFIVDPWWNPAAENQAISRAHRIGQDKHVFVYRFITTGTIEEKIELLKERKSALADKFVNTNDPFKTIPKEEILKLFE